MSETAAPYGDHESRAQSVDLVPQMVCTWEEMKDRLEKLRKFVDEVMKEGQHYGPPYPGSDKLMLYKPGAELLAEIYAYAVMPRVTHRIELWTPAQGGPFFHYEFEADVISKRTGMIVGKGFGSCNTRENRYRWRNAARVCPECNKETIRRSKAEYGGGWYCATRDGGCNAKFKADAPEIADQEVGKIENDDICTQVNTVLQVAKKRCFVASVIAVTQSSGLFESGEDAEDDDDGAPRSTQGGGGKKERTGQRGGSGQQRGGNGAKGGDDKHPLKVTIRGKDYFTAGINASNLLRVWDMARTYDHRFGEDKHKVLLQEKLGVVSSVDLNEVMAEQFLALMRDALDAADAGDKPDGDKPAADKPA